MRTSCIYRISHRNTPDFYIGSSHFFERRWYSHKYDLKARRHGNHNLQRLWDADPDGFVVEIIEVCEPIKAVLLEREQHYIDTLKPALNIAPKAGSRLGSKASDETKAKMAASMKGKNVGKVRTAETREKLREIASSISDETRAKMAAAKRGRKVSDETRAKMRAAKIGIAKNPESMAKTYAKKNENRLAKLKALSEEHCTEGVRVNHKLRKFSEDTVREIMNSGDNDLTLSLKYACSPATIRKIRTRQIYKDVII